MTVRLDGSDQFSVADSADASGTSAGIYVGSYAPGANVSKRPRLDAFSVKASGALTAVPTATSTGVAATPTTGVGAGDSFNRASNAATLGRADSGQLWEYPADSAWGVCGGVRACAIAPAGGEGGHGSRRTSSTSGSRP